MRKWIALFFIGIIVLSVCPSAITTVEIENTSSSAIAPFFVTFGQLFRPGDVSSGMSVEAQTAAGLSVPIQVDAKATHADGSLRHAVITVKSDGLTGAGSVSFGFSAVSASSGTDSFVLDSLLATAYDVVVELNLNDTLYSASARELLVEAGSSGGLRQWLSGPLAGEWNAAAPFKTSGGTLHPHLTARFDVRACQGVGTVRTDVCIENGWAFEPNPSGFTYSVSIRAGGTEVYAKSDLAHTHHCRWHKVVYWGGTEPPVNIRHDIDYLISTGAVPNFDRRVTVSTNALAALVDSFSPMSCGNFTSYMPTTGGHRDIGPLPHFAALYILSMDDRARRSVIANGGCGGSYQIHYRDKEKDLPVTIDDYPYMTIGGNYGDTRNPVTGQYEAFPAVTNPLEVHTPDMAHQPSTAYLPYVITGDYFYLEELQFWSGWNLLWFNPNYRKWEKGLLYPGQLRGQAWTMRTLGHTAYITPDNHPLKYYFEEKLGNNIVWYDSTYVQNPSANKLGTLIDGPSRPWMDDFFTYAMGCLVDLGYASAKPILDFKAVYPVGRMTPPFCWLHAPMYTSLYIKDSVTKEYYPDFTEYYAANFTDTACSSLVMDGYPSGAEGYGANMQPALAAAADAGIPGAAEAWALYETRNPRQDYSAEPQFAVVPRPVAAPSNERPVRKGEECRLAVSPNPFNPEVAIRFIVARPGTQRSVKIFDMAGRVIRDFSAELASDGNEAVTLRWNAGTRASGVYVIRAVAGGVRLTRKAILSK